MNLVFFISNAFIDDNTGGNNNNAPSSSNLPRLVNSSNAVLQKKKKCSNFSMYANNATCLESFFTTAYRIQNELTFDL